MRIAQISDFHFAQVTWNPFRLFSKRLLGNLNWLAVRKRRFFEAQLEPLPALFEELKVDLVLLGGDFSTTALPEEFQKGARFVGQMKQPWIAIPGNHDHYTRRSYREKRVYRYFANNRERALPSLSLEKDQIEAHPIGEGWWVIALDTTLPTGFSSSQGLFPERLERRLEEALLLLPKKASVLLFNHYPFFQNDLQRRNLIRGEALEQLVRRHPQIRLYLHGHTHRHTVADLQVSGLPIVLDSGSCAQGRKGAWNLIDLTADCCTVSTYRWDHRWTKTHTEAFPWTRGDSV